MAVGSILETFYILFKVESGELKKGVEEAEKSTGKIKKSLGEGEKASQAMGQALAAAGTELQGFMARVLSVGAVIGTLKSATSYAADLGTASQALNVNVQDLDAWGNALRRVGGDASTFQQAIRALSLSLNITNQGAVNLLPLLADEFKKHGVEKATRFGESIGLSMPMIMLLQKGSAELDRLIKHERELGLVTKEDTERALKFSYAWQDTTVVFRHAGLILGEILLPALGVVLEATQKTFKFISNHKDLVTGALIAVGAAAAYAFAPFLVGRAAVLAIGAAFALAYDDLMNYLAGNKSVIGELEKEWPRVANIVRKSLDFIKGGMEFIGAGFDQLFGDNPVADRHSHGEHGRLASFFLGNHEDETEKNLGYLKDYSVKKNFSRIPHVLSSRDSNYNINIGTIEVNTQATDAEGIAAGLSKSLNTYMSQALNNSLDGAAI